MKPGFIFFIMAPIEFLILIPLAGHVKQASVWGIIGLVIALTIWAGFRMTFGWNIQRIFGVAVAISFVLAVRLARPLVKVLLRYRKEEIKLPGPKRMAKNSIDYRRAHPKIMARGGVTVILGYSPSRDPISVDLMSQHTLIGASTGAGKTNILNSILIQVCQRKDLRVVIIDPKRDIEDELYVWRALPYVQYVDDMATAISTLRGLVTEMGRRHGESRAKKIPLLVFIDEAATLTTGTEDREHRGAAVRNLELLARQARSARIALIVATQRPGFEILNKSIVNMLLRKVCLFVDTARQAEIILGFNPKVSLPKQPGEFLLKDGIVLKRGRALRVKHGEQQTVVARNLEGELASDKRLALWQTIAVGLEIGSRVPGIQRTYKSNKKWGQVFVSHAYRHLANIGALRPPGKRGEGYRIAVAFMDAIPLIQEYIEGGKWQGEPGAFVRNAR
jgi:hypothetical protein